MALLLRHRTKFHTHPSLLRRLLSTGDSSSPPTPSTTTGTGIGNSDLKTAKPSRLESIRESLLQMKADGKGAATQDRMSLPAYKDVLKSRPDSAQSSKVFGGTSELPESVFGPELNERLVKLREIEEKENHTRMKIVSFRDSREWLIRMDRLEESEKDNAKKISMQRMEILNQIGGTPEYLMGPPEEPLVENFMATKESIQKPNVANWDSSNTKILVDCCMAQNRKLGKPGVQYGSKPWEEIRAEFNKCINQDYTQKQLKNRMDTMRKNWSLWTQLVDKETDLGWNPQSGTIVADAAWWDAKIKVNPAYKKFRYTGLEFHEELKFIFGDAVATSESAWTPTMGIPSESGGKNTPIDVPYIVDSDEDLNFNDDYSPTCNSQPTKKRKTPQGVCVKEAKGKTKFGTATVIRKSLERLVAAAETHNEAEKEEIEATSLFSGKYSIPDCIEILKSLMAEECLNAQQFSYALELIKDVSNRVILMSLKDSRDALMNWILYKYGS